MTDCTMWNLQYKVTKILYMPTKAECPKALHSRVSVLLFLFLIKSTTTKDTVDTSQLIEITSFSWHHNNAFHVIEINGRWRTSCFQQDEQEGHLEAWEGTEVCSQIRHQHLHAAYTRNCYKIAERPAVGITWTPPEIDLQDAVQIYALQDKQPPCTSCRPRSHTLLPNQGTRGRGESASTRME